jgi:hypothetical protein
MIVQRLRRVLTVTLVVCGAAAVASPRVQAQEVLPTEGGMITLVGCFLPGGSHQSKYVLAKPIVGSVVSVTDGNCSAPIDETAVELKDVASKHHGERMLNHVIEVTGRLERLKSSSAASNTTAASTTTADSATDARELREVHVRSFRAVPVVIPTPAAPPEVRYMPAPQPQPQPQAAIPPLPDEKPVATSGTMPTDLPKTASSLPLFGMISLLSLSGALSLHLVGRRRRE